jgi:hypothetical protein
MKHVFEYLPSSLVINTFNHFLGVILDNATYNYQASTRNYVIIDKISR